MRLDERVAVVTGGARGIGAGIASVLATRGARVALLDLDEEEARVTLERLPGAGIALGVDASDETAMTEAVERVARELGRVDVMVNNAGGGTGEQLALEDVRPVPPFTNVTGESWDAQVRNNLRTAYAGCRAAIPHLEAVGGGSIVNISSIAGLMPAVGLPAYGAAKAGVIQLTRSLALELAPRRIRVNAICPGFLWTRAWEGLANFYKMTVPELAELSPREVFLHIVAQQVPMGREQTPEDIGELVAFLASDAAKNITGEEIKVDGGITLKVGGL